MSPKASPKLTHENETARFPPNRAVFFCALRFPRQRRKRARFWGRPRLWAAIMFSMNWRAEFSQL
jgi:hypothetical protein